MALPPPANQGPPIEPWQRQANDLGLSPNEAELYELMTNYHSFTQQQYIALRDQGGYGTLVDLNQWQYKDIKDWCVAISARAVNRGGRTFGDLKIKQLQGIAWWVSDTLLRNQPVNVNVYKADADNYRVNAELDYRDSKADNVTVDKPKAFEYQKWIEWEVSVYSYFSSLNNLKGVPLSYVIRKDLAQGITVASLNERKQQIIYNSPLQGYLFSKDDETVGNILQECCLGTEAESWIKNIKGGRRMMQTLQLHYDGPDEAKKRLNSAKAQLDNIFYRHEATFSFEKYVTALNDIYNTHERYHEPIYETDKVRYLLEKCQNNHAEFKQMVVLCRTQHNTFTAAVTMLKEAVGRLFPDPHNRAGGSKKRNVSQVNSKGNNNNNNKKMVNGVDTSDLSRWFSDDEMKKLPRWLQKKIATNKNHQSKNKDKIDKKKKARVSSVQADNGGSNNNNSGNNSNNSNSASNDSETSRNSLVASVINGIHNSQRQNTIQFPLNGRSASIAAANRTRSNGGGTVDDSSVITFDHLGNPL